MELGYDREGTSSSKKLNEFEDYRLVCFPILNIDVYQMISFYHIV